jgi:DNA-nicking Smr family endonuclease
LYEKELKRKMLRVKKLTTKSLADRTRNLVAGFNPQNDIEGELDLHTFHPRDIKEVLPAYLAACREKGILEVRVVHGKGIGNLQRTVHALLSRMPEVVSYSLAGEHFGGRGATIVHLRAGKVER